MKQLPSLPTKLPDRAKRALARIGDAWRDAAAAAVAGALAWVISMHLFGHATPIFAAVSAIVCLAPGLPNHGRQAVGLILGVSTGIAIGELALYLPGDIPLLRISAAAFFSMIVAASYGLQAVVPIQAGVSAILVHALGSASAGLVRFEDVAVGTAVGLFFSQVLLTPDPLRLLDAAADDLLRRLRDAFETADQALTDDDPARSQVAVNAFSSAHASLVDLTAAIDTARSAARWSLRGRLSARRVNAVSARYDRRAVRAYAASLLFGTAFATAMHRSAGPPPPRLIADLRYAIALCNPNGRYTARPQPAATPAAAWRPTLERIDEAIAALQAFRAIGLVIEPVGRTEATGAFTP